MGLIRSGNTKLTPEDDGGLVEYLWPIVREIIKTAIENHQNLIIEGMEIKIAKYKDIERIAQLANIMWHDSSLEDLESGF